MRGCAKQLLERPLTGTVRSGALVLGVAVAMCAVLPAAGAKPDAGFSVQHAATRLHDGVYRLDAEFELSLPGAPREALDSGVPLYVTIDMRVARERNWWWDETVAALAQRYRLEFHALSGRYLVINLNTGVRHSFRSIDQATAYVGRLMDFPLLDRVLVGEDWRYTGSVSVSLDLGRLPLPMVPGAYFSSEWRLRSEDYRWLLK